MRRLIQGYLKDSLGNIIQGASYYVYKTGTTNEANIYTTLTSSTPATQPLTTDASGKFSFYVSDFDYGSTQLFDIYFPSPVNTTFSSVKGEAILTTYNITSNTTVSYPIKVPYGAIFNISSGVTLTFNSQVEIGKYQAFSGPGTVSFTSGSEVKVSWFSSLSTAISMLGSNNINLIIDTNQTVSANLTIPSNILLKVLKGNTLSISFGVTLTINGPFEAGLYQVFSGDGSVSFGSGSVAEVYPEWWGLSTSADASTNTAAIHKAMNSFRHVRIPTTGTIPIETITFPTSYTHLKLNSTTTLSYSGTGYAIVIYGLNFCELEGGNISVPNGNGILLYCSGTGSNYCLYNKISKVNIGGTRASTPSLTDDKRGIELKNDGTYFNIIDKVRIRSIDTGIYFHDNANANSVYEPQLEVYWYGVRIDSVENRIIGGFFHYSAGSDPYYTYCYYLESNALMNFIDDANAEPGSYSRPYYIDVNAVANRVYGIWNISSPGINASKSGQNSTSYYSPLQASGRELKEDTYYAIGSFSFSGYQYCSCIIQLDWNYYHAEIGEYNSGYAVLAVYRHDTSFLVSVLDRSSQLQSGGLVGLKIDSGSYTFYPVFYIVNKGTHTQVGVIRYTVTSIVGYKTGSFDSSYFEESPTITTYLSNYITFPNGATTPSVEGSEVFYVSNSSSTTITNFTGGIEGKRITLVFSNANTTIKHGTNIYNRCGANVTPPANTTRTYVKVSGKWYEVSF